ncbi:MAG TPA: hypothetical protein EYP54_11490 [Anaerolineales bacterium]|nr:hypothetical protein [Anaerolineales bacterium]
MKLWQRAGRLVGVEPVLVARRGRVRTPTRAEAAAMLEAAIAALEAAGVPVRVLNLDGYAVVLIHGAKWRSEPDEPQGYLVDLDAAFGAGHERLQSARPEPLRSRARVDAGD